MTMRRVIAGAIASAALLGLMAGTAGAAGNTTVVTLTCGSVTEQVAVAGNGQFTAARSLTSTTVYVPVSFGTFTGTVYDTFGNVVDQFTEPGPNLKGKNGTGVQNTVSCSYTQSFVSDGTDPSFPFPAGYRFEGVGQATALVTPQAHK